MQEAEFKELYQAMNGYLNFHGSPECEYNRYNTVAGIDEELTALASKMAELREKRAKLVEDGKDATTALITCIKRIANRI